jgi:3-oxoacyl-(acyl-carrier-protein) synthase
MSSTKAFTGHTLGASGGIEAVFSVMAIEQRSLFPNLRFETPIPEIDIRPQLSFESDKKVNHVMSNSFGFGGNCSSIIFLLPDMPVYIKGMGNISPQKTWGDDQLLAKPSDYSGSKLSCIEPDYAQFMDVKQLRRMSRIIKMGVAAGTMALREAGINTPDGIITGTSFGCLEDTGVFLTKLIENKEFALNPTPFIQSTHNTIGSQIALLLQCQGYNQTYTQRAFSFEHALLDAVLELKDNPQQHILVGGVDEIILIATLFKNVLGSLAIDRQAWIC